MLPLAGWYHIQDIKGILQGGPIKIAPCKVHFALILDLFYLFLICFVS